MTKKVLNKQEAEEKFEVIETKVKRDKHPNEWKYPGRNNNEYNVAFMKYSAKLNKEQYSLFAQKKLVLNEDRTAKFIEEMQVDDLVGIGNAMYKVTSKSNDAVLAINQMTNTSTTLTLADIDFALEIGFADILRRNGEVYGDNTEQTVKIFVPKKKEE